ncbi:hypothetical protein C8J57DRAFT_1214966 [Mycena rebaudengoi]|nr:hypothetical protein C8J57DRAFT_1214966 [Mycena rebaudengoi]
MSLYTQYTTLMLPLCAAVLSFLFEEHIEVTQLDALEGGGFSGISWRVVGLLIPVSDSTEATELLGTILNIFFPNTGPLFAWTNPVLFLHATMLLSQFATEQENLKVQMQMAGQRIGSALQRTSLLINVQGILGLIGVILPTEPIARLRIAGEIFPAALFPQSHRILRFISAGVTDWDSVQTQILDGPLAVFQLTALRDNGVMFKAVLDLVLSGVAWSCLVKNDLYLNYQEGIEDHIRRLHNKQKLLRSRSPISTEESDEAEFMSKSNLSSSKSSGQSEADPTYWKNSERVDEYCSSEIRWQPRTQAGWVNSNGDNSPGLGDQFLCPRGSNLNHGRKSLKCTSGWV